MHAALPTDAGPPANPLLAAVESPPIPQAHAWGAAYDGALGPLLDLCQAVPGYPPHPDLLAHAAEAALGRECARYGLILGDLDLREAHAAELSRTYDGAVAASQVAVTAGCNQAFFLAMLVLAGTGDNVVMPVPWFWNHQQTCQMLGIEPRPLPCRAADGFVPDPEEAARHIDARTRALLLITPNNPTGAVYPPAVIARFHALCEQRGIALILDETYRDFLPAGQSRGHSLFQRDDWDRHLVQIYSFSKAYCVPGFRLGTFTAAAALVGQAEKALDCLHICPNRAAQAALAWAIPALGGWRAANRARINARAAKVGEGFQSLASWRLDSLGAYFAYVRHPYAGLTAAQAAERLALTRGALGLPGSAFGPDQEGHLRLAFANIDEEGIAELARRLAGG